MIDRDVLKALTEAPSVGTACLPMIRLLTTWLGAGYSRTLVSDGFCLFQKAGASPQELRVVFVAHLDEIGGCVYGAYDETGYVTRCWGNAPSIFQEASLQAFDYLAEVQEEAFPVTSRLALVGDDLRLILEGEGIRPYRTAFTFQEETTFAGDLIEGKALDPRVTLYAVAEAARALDSGAVGMMFVMAEECCMEVAQKGVAFLMRHAPNLELLVNADVPWINNIGEGRLDLPAIRIFEGRNFINPMFGIRVAERMQQRGAEFHLSAARSGSQTLLFTPLAPTLSIALPSDGVHLPRVRMSLLGTERCIALLQAIGESALQGEFAF